MIRLRLPLAVVLLASLLPLGRSDEGSPPGGGQVSEESSPQFERDILPILRTHCLKCHGPKSRKAELDLSTLGGLLRGGESGEAVLLRGKADKSHVVELVESGQMPPGKSRLSKAETSLIRRWIDAGASGEAGLDDDVLSEEQLLARRIHSLLEVKCMPCHGRAEQQGGLDLRTMASALKGGKRGPALVRGDAEKSLIVSRIANDEMPPRDVRYKRSIKPVTESELKQIRKWIDHGAIDPPSPPGLVRDDGLLVDDKDRSWWAFQKPKAVAVPSVRNADRVRTPIDAFLLRRLEEGGLAFSTEADRRTLIRRLSVDLIGLLPEPDEVRAFVEDDSPEAYEKLVERLLASPHYGEHWGQHWLDAAGYSDSEGSASADFIYPRTWNYRDYVIRALNSDKPYDRFLIEQLAGDELTDYRQVPRVTPELRDNIIATGFLRTCIDPTTSPETNFLYDRYQVLADTVEIVSSSLMGLTMRCARCHSHKYDPLPMRDYYRFTAIFASAYSPYEWVKPQARVVEMAGVEDRVDIVRHNAEINNQIHPLNVRRSELTQSYQTKFRDQKLAELPESIRNAVQEAVTTSADKRTQAQKKLAEEHEKKLTADEKTLLAAFPEFKKQVDQLQQKKKGLEAQHRRVEVAHGLADMRTTPDPFYLLKRGEWNRRGRQVLANVPAVLQDSTKPFRITHPENNETTSGQRLSFARWLTKPDHPLTARVFVNRIWQHHFGMGLVATPDDFGQTGSTPSHPELLDWLAVEFVRRGWSLKDLHRLIVTSSGWRQQSRVRPKAAAIDPENRLLWRMPLRRMSAEVLRDSLLAVTGELNSKMNGAPVGVTSNSDGQVITDESAPGRRRSVFLLHRRSQPVTVLETFDLPRMTTNCLKRRTSNVVSQALLLLNSGFADRRAARLAERILHEAGDDRRKQITLATQKVLGRLPTDEELHIGLEFVEAQSAGYGQKAAQKRPPKVTSLIGMHASKGITFDLQAVRKAHPGFAVTSFAAVAALGYYPDDLGDAHYQICLDGKTVQSGHLRNNTFELVSQKLSEKQRFLTLMTLSNGSMSTDWTFFGNPVLSLVSSDGQTKSLNLADIVAGGDGTGTGADRGINPWNGHVEEKRAGSTQGTSDKANAVSWSPLIDAVFVPNGSGKEIEVSTSGLRVKGVSVGSAGVTYGHIWNGHNNGVTGLKTPSIAEASPALVDYCLVLMNSAEFLYVD